MVKKCWVLILCFEFFTLSFNIIAQKITFENFVKKFPVSNLPYKMDRKTIDKTFSGLTKLSPNEIKEFLLQKATDTVTLGYLIEDAQAEFANVIQNKVQFFAVNKLNIYTEITTLVVYRFDKTVEKGTGILAYDFFLFNFDTKNKLINTIGLAKEEYFMSARFNEGFLEKNSAGEIIFKNVETDYNEYDKSKQRKSNYETETYHVLTKKMTLENIDERYFPYSGTFSYGNDEIHIYQNKKLFGVNRGEKNSGGSTGQELIAYDLQKGIFTIKTEDMGLVQGVFNAGKTEIKIIKADKKVLLYKRISKW